jgi:predicted small metal-binding protein
MARKMADCRRFESDMNCSLVIIGDEEEVVRAATEHAVSAHGHTDTPEMRAGVRATLEEADAYDPAPRTPEPFPA